MAGDRYGTDPDGYRDAVIAALEDVESAEVADAAAE